MVFSVYEVDIPPQLPIYANRYLWKVIQTYSLDKRGVIYMKQTLEYYTVKHNDQFEKTPFRDRTEFFWMTFLCIIFMILNIVMTIHYLIAIQ